MAGVGEASAIVGLISTAASLSKAVIDIASKYKVARLQIESFGQEVGILGNILDQLHRLYSKDNLRSDGGVISVTVDILDQCSGLFAELETYRDTLYSRTGSVRNVTFLGKTKWVFEEKELEYLRTRVESMKINMLLMMIMQCVHGLQRSNMENPVETYVEQARILSFQSQECAKRLQPLKNDVVAPTSTNANTVNNRMSIDTAASARSITESILSLYGHESLYETPSESQGEVLGTRGMQVDQARVSRIIEYHIRKSAVVDEDGPVSEKHEKKDKKEKYEKKNEKSKKSKKGHADPLITSCVFRHCSKCSTANNDEAIEGLKVEHFNHIAATELGSFTDDSEDGLDFFLRNTCGVTLRESYFLVLSSAVQYHENSKDWGYYEICITLEHRVRDLQLDERTMIIDSLVRQLQLLDPFRLRWVVVPVTGEYLTTR